MQKPTIHSNGTSKDALLKQLRDAHDALMDASRALAYASPHGRDYYLSGDVAYMEARQEHQNRMARLRLTIDEIYELYVHVADQS
jgi:ferredoxin-NADP reductase